MRTEELATKVLTEWNRRQLTQGYKKSFDFYLKMHYPQYYDSVMKKVKYDYGVRQ